MLISIVLVHDKTDQDNIDQIETLKSLLTVVTYTEEIRDENGQVIAVGDAFYYELADLEVSNHIKVSQVVPYGVTPPSNMGDINSRRVIYGNGDEDKTGTHPRFFNWGAIRAASNHKRVVIYIKDIEALTILSLDEQLATIDVTLLSDTSASVMMACTVIKNFGVLDESMTFANAITDLIGRIG